MGMEDFVLLGGLAAMAIFGYYIMTRLDRFLDQVRPKSEAQGGATCFNIATSCFDAIPAVSDILKEINYLYPSVHCSLSVGYEQEVIRSFERGDADVAIISAASDVESKPLTQWKSLALDLRPGSIDPIEHGIVEVRAVENSPQPQKVLWKSGDNRFLVQSFIHGLCGQKP